MVKKKGPLDRIEKVVKKRRSFHSVSDTSTVSSPKVFYLFIFTCLLFTILIGLQLFLTADKIIKKDFLQTNKFR